MKLILLSLLMFNFAACSSRQKKVCLRNAAYQHGYQAAQKGEAAEASSLYQGGVCQDYEAYSPTMYRQDFMAGYGKGKQDHCNELNYKNWGSQDGESGSVDSGANYTSKMRICLLDPEYKKKAEKTYQQAFTQSFCTEDRLAEMGKQQALNFSPLSVPDIKNRCGKKTSSMTSAMKSAYKAQMKTNCTKSFWMLKGEQDAKEKLTKASQVSKVDMCPASKRDSFVSAYSAAYNERRALLIEEEKLALEKKRQQEMMALEKKKQQQHYELEKEKLALEKDKYAGGHGGHHSSFNRPITFYKDGNRIVSSCRVDTRQSEGRVTVTNRGRRHVFLSGNWSIRYYDDRRRLLKTEQEYESLSLSSNETETFNDSFIPHHAVFCSARYNK